MKIDKASLAARAFKELFDSLDIAYAYVSPELQIVYASENFSDFTALQQAEISGCPLTEAFPGLTGSEGSLGCLLAGEIHVFRRDHIDHLIPEDTTRPLNFVFLPFDEGQPDQGLLLLVEDAFQTSVIESHLAQTQSELDQTKERLFQAEEALQKLRQIKSLILSTAAHDMRTPLNAILGYSEWIYGDLPQESDSENQELLSIIISQAQLLDHLITDLLDLDQIEQGKLRLTPRPCEVNEIIHRVSASVKAMVDFQDQALDLLLPELPLIVQADPDRLTQILYNLLGNAIKYTPEGGRIQIHAYRETDNAVLCVQDDGAAISPAEQAQLFQLSFHKDGVRRSLSRGAGLGMYLVKTLVEAHKGSIDVVSKPAQGVAITIRLPLVQKEI